MSVSSPYSISLDMGTNSIGYVVFLLDSSTEAPNRILDLGVRIFNDGRDAKTKTPLAVERREARGVRRNRDRKKNRIQRLIKELTEFGLLPEFKVERDSIFKLCPYECRAKAAVEKVSKNMLARAIVHIANNRGFKSNRLSGEHEDSNFFQKIDALINELEGNTLGQFLYARKLVNDEQLSLGLNKNLKPLKFKPIENQFYPNRQMLEDEFSLLKKINREHLTETQWQAIEETVFWQYPLKLAEKGRCRFFPEETRAYSALPISHEFRILQDINNLKYVSEGQQHQLDKRQRLHLIELFNKQKSISFKSLLRQKDIHQSPIFPADSKFNLDTPVRNGKLFGNETLIELGKSEYLGSLISIIPYTSLNRLVAHLIEPVKIVTDKRGNKIKVVEEVSETKKEIKSLVPELDVDAITNLACKSFSKKTTNLSVKFMELVLPYMRTGIQYHDAVTKVVDEAGIAFHHSQSNIKPTHEALPYYGKILTDSVTGQFNQVDQDKVESDRDNEAFLHGKIANPTVHIALNQLRRVVNQIIKSFGAKPAKINIELTRELKNSLQSRKRIEKNNKDNAKHNERIRQDISELTGISYISRSDIQKYKLWEELGVLGARQCVFSGKTISVSQLFNGAVEVEHIIPFSRSYDDGMNNKTLAFKSVNNIKQNKTPYEAFGNTEEYSQILQRALQAFGQSSKYERFKKGAFEYFYGENGQNNFIERQLNDTKYISKVARTYLSCLIPIQNIIPVNGQITAMLRHIWGLNHFKNKASGNYRDDHRHHIIDAFVVGLTSRSLIQNLNTVNATSNRNEDSLFVLLKNRSKVPDALRAEFLRMLDGVIASHRRDHGLQGSLFNDTAYGLDASKNTYITRKNITSLSVDELFRIRDATIRHDLFTYLVNRPEIENKREFLSVFGDVKTLERKLHQFVCETGHKKLRIDIQNASIKTIKSAPFKAYALNSYSFVDIWQIPTKKDKKTEKWLYKYEGNFVATVEARQRLKHNNEDRPHPAAKFVMRLFKQDSIKLVDTQTGEETFCRVAGFSASNNKLDIQPNLKSGSSQQKFMTINKIFGGNKVEKFRT